LETSNLAIGLATGAIDLIEAESATRPDLAPVAAQFRSSTTAARERLHALAVTPDADATLAARVKCTRLALRATQTALVAAKGAGFVSPHPAQRLARQALFFLVWSCPRPVAAGVLDDLVSSE
jgi:alkylation response protein AidB-like acyl-CoA dehydrogenase